MSDVHTRLTTALAGRYRVDRELGAGGMATVYLAHDLKHERDVAIKVLHPELAAAVGAERFQAEIRITAQLQHPHIVPVFDSGSADGLLYFVMPRIEGETLRQRLDRTGPLGIDEVRRFARELAGALAYAHGRGILHRDLKPENVMISGGHLLLADFGIATSHTSTAAQRLTQTGMSVGTPVYMSPEQAVGDRTLTPASDVYALGVILFELLTGTVPFAGPTYEAILVQRFTQDAPRCLARRADTPPAMDAAVARALARDPAERFDSARAFAAALGGGERDARPAGIALAVLPFVNLSADAENGYFADGLTEEVILTLSKVQALRVSSRTSIMQYRERAGAPREVAQALGVTHLLEGSVRRAGARIRITASLLDAEADQSLWSERFDGTLDDVFEMQDRVAAAIVSALQLTLSPQEQARLREHPITSPAAYDAYLRAREGLNAFSATGLQQALACLEEAARLEPDNVFVLRGLGRACWAAVNNSVSSDLGLLDQALGYAAAIERLQPDSPYVAEIRGLVAIMRGDLTTGLREKAVAYEAMPEDPDIGFWYSTGLLLAGQTDASLVVIRDVSRRDPDNGFARLMVDIFGEMAGGHMDRVARVDAGPDGAPPAVWALLHGLGAMRDGDLPLARRVLDTAATLPPDPYTGMSAFLRRAIDGDAEGARTALTAELERILWHDFTYTEYVAVGFACLGDVPNMVRWLGRSAQLGLGLHAFLTRDHAVWQPWLSHPEVAPLMEVIRRNAERYAAIALAPRVTAMLADEERP